MQEKPPIRMLILAGFLLLCMAGMMLRFYDLSRGDGISAAAVREGNYHLSVPVSEGVIYDRNFRPLNQSEQKILAVVNPTPETMASIFAKIQDQEAVSAALQKRAPFVCTLTEAPAETPDLRLLPGRADAEGALPAQHLLGYRQNGNGVSGLMGAYDAWLQSCDTSADIRFTVNGAGSVLSGAENSVIMQGKPGGGVVTTLDSEIQAIAEHALASAAPYAGAAVVLNTDTGDIAACASTPVYHPDRLADALENPQSPFLNRALSAYSVGSVFKLVTAAAALENGFPAQYMYTCTGKADVYGQTFRCHKQDGHGLLNMEDALVYSCNPYFISLSQVLTADMLHDTAYALGFGREIVLADGVTSKAGVLPSAEELSVEAEKANFSFGQGKLLATPLQVAAMTACIANGGVYSVPRLTVGLTENGETLISEQTGKQYRALRPETAEQLRRMAQAVLLRADNPKGRPASVSAGGKTSTAQTGQFAEDGSEYCHAWMTGFFPAKKPRYAVTVLIEKGGSGNQTAAPVFRRIIDEMTARNL